MPRNEQTVAYGTETVIPSTAGRIPRFATTGIPAKITNSAAFLEADNGRQVIIGVGASVNAGQVSPNPIVVIGDGAGGWGIGAIAIGRNVVAGLNAARDGCIAIGYGISVDAKGSIRIGSALAFGGAFCDAIAIGTQTTNGGQNSVGIGSGANAQASSVAIGDTPIGTEPWAVAIGYQAACVNSGNGTGSKCIAIGYQAVANVVAPGDQSAIAIGRVASALGRNSIAIGFGANVPYAAGANDGSIAIGYGATVTRTAELVFGDNAATKVITLVTVRAGAGIMVKHRSGGAGGWGIRNNADTADIFQVDESAVVNDVRLLVYDVTAAALRRVTIGAANSGGAGFRTLIIPN